MLRRSLLGVTLALATHGCAKDCTELGCTPGVEIVFSQALDASSTYSIEVITESEVIRCEVNVARAEDCPGLQLLVTGSGRTVAGSGAPLPSGGLAGVLVLGAPSVVSIDVSDLSGGNIASDSAAPKYRDVEINGEGCGGCRLATMTVEVTP